MITINETNETIYFIAQYEASPQDGEGVRYHHICKMLNKKGYNTKIICSSYLHRKQIERINNRVTHEEKSIDGVDYLYIKTNFLYKKNASVLRFLNMLSFSNNLRKVLKDIKKPKFIVTDVMNIFSGVIGVQYAQKNKIQHISEIRDVWPESIVLFNHLSGKNPIVKIWNILNKFVYTRSKCITSTLPLIYKHLEKYKLNIEKTVIIPNGVDLNTFKQHSSRYLFETNYIMNLVEKFKCFVFAGGFTEYNDLFTLLKAASLINDKDVKILLIGGGPLENKLKETVNIRKIENVIFIDTINQESLAWILSKSYANIILTKNSGIYKFGNSQKKVNEYLAAARPLIFATNNLENELKKVESVFIAEPESPESIASVINEISNIPINQIEELGKLSYDFAARYRDLPKLVEQYINIFEEI